MCIQIGFDSPLTIIILWISGLCLNSIHIPTSTKRNDPTMTTRYAKRYKIASYEGAWNNLPYYPPYNLFPPIHYIPAPKIPLRSRKTTLIVSTTSTFIVYSSTNIKQPKEVNLMPYLVGIHGDSITILFNQSLPNVSENWPSSVKEKEAGHFNRFKHSEDHSGALAYIVFVLIFYSTAIVIMMAKYMRREHKEYQDAKKYQKYVKSAREVYMRSISRSRATNKLALQAFNTINLIPQITNTYEKPKITYV